MALNIVELQQQRGTLIEQIRRLHEGTVERGTITGEEKEQFQKMETDCRGLEELIAREETVQKLEADAAKSAQIAAEANGNNHRNGNSNRGDGTHNFEPFRYPLGQAPVSRMEHERRVSKAVQGWMRMAKPQGVLEQEHIDCAKSLGIPDLRANQIDLPLVKDYRGWQKEYRVGLDVATTGAGKETIPQGFVYALEQALLAYGGVRVNATVIRTDSGNDLPYPTMNDTTNVGAILAEATTIGASVDPVFASLVLKAFKYSSKPILMSYELTQDSAFDLGSLVGDWLGTRIARIQNTHFTTGAGSTLPKGLTVAGVVGKTAASMTTFTSDEVIDLIHSVDPSYRPGASFMFHDTVLAAIRKLKESTTNAYIWQPGLQLGVPDRLLSYRYTVNQSMSSAFTTGQKLILFGDLSKYLVRDVSTIRLVRLDERYADLDQIAFIAFMRTDGNLLDAGTRPVKWLALA